MINVEAATDTLVGETRRVARPNSAEKKTRVQSFAVGLSDAEILEELRRIVGSGDFRASERNRRVLQYIVECALQGRREDATAYHIATRIYGRRPTFNPLKDPIVRIEMARLRRDLEMYYLQGGRTSALRIGIPKGGYFPEVTRSVPSDEACDSRQASPFLVSVLRASLNAWSGAHDAAAAAWQDLLLADPDLTAHLHASVLREVGDEEVAKLIVEGALRSDRQTTRENHAR